MNCKSIRDQLPGLVYGDLPSAEKAEAEQHLAECPGCMKEFKALQEVRVLLGTRAAPETRVDMGRLYRQAAELQAQRLRRWRRVALAVTGVAALIAILAVGLRLEARFEQHQVVLRWGAPPAQPAEARAAPPSGSPLPLPPAETRVSHVSEEQLQLLGKLIHALADDLQSLERLQRQDSTRFQSRLQSLQEQTLQRCATIERNVEALYLLSQKGE